MRSFKLLILFALFVTGCKQDVSFKPTENDPADRSSTGGATPVPAVAPKVELVTKPQDHLLGDSTSARYKITEGSTEIVSVDCYLDNLAIECEQANSKVLLQVEAIGLHNFVVKVIDENGLEASDKAVWNVTKRPVVPPQVSLIEKPMNHMAGETTFASYTVTPGSGVVSSVVCLIDNKPIPCKKDEDRLQLKETQLGQHDFFVKVRDENGLEATAQATWTVSSRPVVVPPQVNIFESPQNHLEGESTSVSYKVTKGTYAIQSVKCYVDDKLISCKKNQDRIMLKESKIGQHQFVVKVEDKNGLRASDKASWKVDPRPTVYPPEVTINQKPKDHMQGESTQVAYQVTQGTYDILDVSCFVDQKKVNCAIDQDTLLLQELSLGNHAFQVVVKDIKNNQAQDKASWNVTEKIVKKMTSVNVEFVKQPADILFVIDNSISMQEEQLEVASRIDKLFTKVKDLDWRIGIITTDPYEYNPYKGFVYNPLADGALLEFPNGEYYLKSDIPVSQAKDLFKETIFRPEKGDGQERGIHNTFRAIERSLDPTNLVNQRLNEFFRDKASLSVVVISDEDETLVNGVGDPLNDLDKSEPQNLVQLVKDVWGVEKLFQFNSVIVEPGDFECINSNEKFGKIYKEMAELTGGVVEDICADDYSGALSKIGSGIVDLQTIYKLSCVPIDKNKNGVADDVVVTPVTGGAVPNFKITADKIEFEKPLQQGLYNFEYYCVE